MRSNSSEVVPSVSHIKYSEVEKGSLKLQVIRRCYLHQLSHCLTFTQFYSRLPVPATQTVAYMKSVMAFCNRLSNMGPQSIAERENKSTFTGKIKIVKSSFSGHFALLSLSYFQSSSNCSPNFLQSILRGFLRNASKQ